MKNRPLPWLLIALDESRFDKSGLALCLKTVTVAADSEHLVVYILFLLFDVLFVIRIIYIQMLFIACSLNIFTPVIHYVSSNNKECCLDKHLQQ
jgi:hypothetical protein